MTCREISLLIDAVEAANFITPRKKPSILLQKLESLVSKWQAEELDKHIFIENRNKCSNEEILYTIDTINEAINKNRKITFSYIKDLSERTIALAKVTNSLR